jgi:protein TonB
MFDSVLGQGVTPKSRWGVGTVVSVGAHVALLGFALWISSQPPADEKDDVEVVFRAPPPPPPPPPAGKKSSGRTKPKIERKVEKRIVKPETIVQPKEIPQEKPAEAEPEESEDEGEEGGVEGGVVGGVQGGVVGGVIGGTLGGTLGGELGGEILPFGEGMTPPVRVSGRDPVYTREALEARVQGTVLVKCTVTSEGALEHCKVIKGLPHMEGAILEALSTHRYTPVRFQGRVVSVSKTFTFRLQMPNR